MDVKNVWESYYVYAWRKNLKEEMENERKRKKVWTKQRKKWLRKDNRDRKSSSFCKRLKHNVKFYRLKIIQSGFRQEWPVQWRLVFSD
jgi:hypothetical protein